MRTIITIIGFGNIGREVCFSLLQKKDEFLIHIIDPSDKIVGSFKDMIQASSFENKHQIEFNQEELFNASHYIFHCTGANVPIDASRLSVVGESISITEKVFENYKPQPNAKIIIVSNPVEIISFITKKLTGLPGSNIVGTGTSLDSIRMNYLAKIKFPHFKNPNFILIGEHGQHLILDKNRSIINSTKVDLLLGENEISELMTDVKECAREIKRTQKFTVYGPVMSALKIFDCMFKNERCDFPVSTEIPKYVQVKYNFKPIFLSLYSEIDHKGAHVKMEHFDFSQLEESYQALLKVIPDKYLS